MVHFNLDHAVECMQTIVDCHKCIACDKLDGPFVRYPCGHSTCRSCYETAEDCVLCLTPPPISTHFVDEPLSRRTEHVSNLLLAFQDLFNLNVCRHLRLSEQQKLENQVFPTGIQASFKYCNKRKSLNVSIADKENTIPFLPGENTSYSHSKKMERTIENVQHWLRNNDTNLKESPNLPRKPFADLNVNCLSLSKTKTGGLKNNRVNNKKQTQRRKQPKRKKLLLIKQECQTLMNTSFIERKNKINKSENFSNEDVIVIEESQIDNINNNENFKDEDVIEIDESQKDHIDKDKLAWMSVLRDAEKTQSDATKNTLTETSNISLKSKHKCSTPINTMSLDSYKVPFYKRGVLYETCKLCEKDQIVKGTKSTKINKGNNVTVGINSDVYEINIKISDCGNDFKLISKESVAVQTDTFDCDDEIQTDPQQCAKTTVSQVSPSLLQNVMNSIDLFEPDTGNDINNVYKTHQKLEVNKKNHNKSVIVEESETESESGNENSKTIEVVAQVHTSQSYNDRKVLSTLEPKQYNNRKTNPIRGRTPLSTDSSDKENYDPNRAKRRRLSKKCIKKK